MKTITLFLTLLSTVLLHAQHNDGELKLNECKRLTLDLLRNNTKNDDLTNCLVSMASQGGGYVEQYNSWMSQVSQNSQEELQAELNNLEAQKQQATEIRQQSFNSMLNNVTQNVQNQAQQNAQNKQQSINVKTQPNGAKDCVNRPGYGCGQQ